MFVWCQEYIGHLSSQRHAESLRKISLQHRMSLAKLRTRQRKEQLQIEAQSSRPAHSSRMNFCAICKLYHSESRPNHETTELHKIIKNFLMPYCPICRVNFKSRMLYEKHVATLTHIKVSVHRSRLHYNVPFLDYELFVNNFRTKLIWRKPTNVVVRRSGKRTQLVTRKILYYSISITL